MLDTESLLKSTDFPALNRRSVDILQINLGYLCNLSCTHCHVNAGPKRTELASLETIELALAFIRNNTIRTLDVTGGAPEMNPHFKYLVTQARRLGVEVIDRCNLTILNEPGYEDMAQFLADQEVVVTASLPCYQEQNVQEQRGKGVFASSIEALQKLNALGYGQQKGLKLDLVYNPNGAFLPPEQVGLEQAYKQELKDNYGIIFDQLLTITNMPISRFGSMLLSKDMYHDYMNLLRDNYAKENLASVMCLNLISIDWQGYIYDCDFNQMLNWPMLPHHNSLQGHGAPSDATIATDSVRPHLRDILEADLAGKPIVIGDHCYGCTAGQGSSCGGALT